MKRPRCKKCKHTMKGHKKQKKQYHTWDKIAVMFSGIHNSRLPKVKNKKSYSSRYETIIIFNTWNSTM